MQLLESSSSQITQSIKALESLIGKDLSPIVEVLANSTDKEVLWKARIEVRNILDSINIAIVRTFMYRQQFMWLIAASKKEWDPILQLEREWEVIKNAGNIAIEAWEDEKYTEMLIWMITAAAKDKQRKILDRELVFVQEEIDRWILFQNSINLRDKVASSYAMYGDWFDATKFSRLHEAKAIQELIGTMENKWSALSLLSADGSIGRLLIEWWFKKVIWYDISSRMVEVAQKNQISSNESYCILEMGDMLNIEKESMDLVVADFGSASELNEWLLETISTVLKPWGIAYLSYYNSDAFAHTWWQPWQTSIEAILNPLSDILEVPLIDPVTRKCQSYKIYAKWKSFVEITEEAKNMNLHISDVSSFPLLFTMMPPTFFTEEKRIKEAMEYDEIHGKVAPFKGYYLNIVLKK